MWYGKRFKKVSFRFFELLLLTSIPLQVNSAALETDFLVYAPKVLTGDLATRVRGSYYYQRGQFVIGGEIPIAIDDFDVTVGYQFKSLDISGAKSFRANIDFTTIKARMSGLHIDSIAERVVNGVVVRIRMKVDCQNVVLESRSVIPASGNGSLSNFPIMARFDQLNWIPRIDHWSLTSASCQGPSDAMSFLEEQLNQIWVKSTQVQNIVLEEANFRLVSWLEENQTWTHDFTELQSTALLRAQELVDTGKSWVIRFGLELHSRGECDAFFKEGKLQSPEVRSGVENFEIQFNSRVVNLAAKCMHEMGLMKRKDLSRNIPAFQDLLNSSIKRQFVWPDLGRFSSQSQFEFHAKTVDEFNFYGKNVDSATERANPNTIFFNGYANIETKLLHQSNGTLRPYVTFDSVVRGALALKMKTPSPKWPTEFSVRRFGLAEVALAYHWDVPLNQLRSQKIETDLIKEALLNGVMNSEVRFQLGPFNITDSHLVNFKGISKEGLLMKIQLLLGAR